MKRPLSLTTTQLNVIHDYADRGVGGMTERRRLGLRPRVALAPRISPRAALNDPALLGTVLDGDSW